MSLESNWRATPLGDLVSFRTGKLDSNASLPDGKYPFFTCSPTTLRTNTFSFEGEYVLLAGNNANGIFPLKYFEGKFDAYQRTYAIQTLDPAKLDNRFLYYALQLKLAELRRLSTGAATKFLTLSILNALEIPLPSIEMQRQIADTLSAYDDLIENNTRRIAILEEMAQRLYREWFVHFRYPGHESVPLVESELGLIPEGWELDVVGTVLDRLESGSRPKGGIDPATRGVPSVGAENILGLGQYDYSKEKYISREFYDTMRRGHVESGDVLLYKDGAHIGRKSLFRDGFPHIECCVNEHVFILRTSDPHLSAYLYFWLDQPSMTERIVRLNANAAQPGINQEGVRNLPLLIPPSGVTTLFHRTAEPMMALLFSLAKLRPILSATRDLLLARLT